MFWNMRTNPLAGGNRIPGRYLPPTPIVGLFGTNFEGVPGFEPAYFVAMALALPIITGVRLFLFGRHKGVELAHRQRADNRV